MILGHIVQLMGLAAIDSVNMLAFAVIAGLWLSLRDKKGTFAPRAAQFTGGAFLGILGLAMLSVWVIGSNQDLVRRLWDNPIAAIVAGVIGIVLLVLGLRVSASPRAERSAATLADSRREGYEDAAVDALEEAIAEESPIPKSVMRSIGLFGTGIMLGIIQSGTSVPFAGGVVIISFAETSLVQQIVEILVFALVAIAPSALLIAVLSKVRGNGVDGATVRINAFLDRAKVLGRWLTIGLGAGLVVLGVVRLVQLGVLG